MANFPTRKISQNLNPLAFPNDLLSNSDRPHMSIHFVNYRYAFKTGTTLGAGLSTLGGTAASFIGGAGDLINNISGLYNEISGGRYLLPIPKRLNEGQSVVWNETSVLESFPTIKSGAESVLGPLTSAITGIQINPFQLLYFQRPAFREFSFSWTLAPNSPRESQTLQQMIRQFKIAQLPSIAGPFFDYPFIAIIKFLPNDLNDHLKLKPCAITSLQIDHVGSANPSFFKNSRGAPTIVNMSINLKEIDIQTQNDYTGVSKGKAVEDFINTGTEIISGVANAASRFLSGGGTTPGSGGR